MFNRDSFNLVAYLKSLHTLKYEQQQFLFTGDTTTVQFDLPTGWKPYQVFEAGLLVREGSSDEYVVTNNGINYGVDFTVGGAPAAVEVTIIGVRT